MRLHLFCFFSLGSTLGCGLYAGAGYTHENTVFPSAHFVDASEHFAALTVLHKAGKQSISHRIENKNTAIFVRLLKTVTITLKKVLNENAMKTGALAVLVTMQILYLQHNH